jgi:hypothetical protein
MVVIVVFPGATFNFRRFLAVLRLVLRGKLGFLLGMANEAL